MTTLWAMSDLLLERSGQRLEDYYDVIADGAVIGRIMLFTSHSDWAAMGVDHGAWAWDPTQTHGYEATKEAALEALSRAWKRE
jgi:hypothetical protein